MDLKEQLTKYLTDAHSIEAQALQQLRKAPDIAGEPSFAAALEEHRRQTEEHEEAVRRLLEERGAEPSSLKDTVMRIGGEAFGLFARFQTDTPGKLASHALAYEALEWASYDLLARTADRAGEPRVAEVARRIRGEERAMMERIEALLDRTATASIDEAVTDDLRGHLKRYLADAHALEQQSIELLERAVEAVDRPALRSVFEAHLPESRTQAERVERRLGDHGDGPSLLKDAAMRLAGLDWSTFFRGHPDTPGKLAAFAYAFEHLEIGGYEQLRTVAELAGDRETVETAGRILEEERSAARSLADVFDEAVDASLAAKAS